MKLQNEQIIGDVGSSSAKKSISFSEASRRIAKDRRTIKPFQPSDFHAIVDQYVNHMRSMDGGQRGPSPVKSLSPGPSSLSPKLGGLGASGSPLSLLHPSKMQIYEGG